MKRIVKRLLLAIAVVLALAIVIVNLGTPAAPDVPAADLDASIEVEDGVFRRLGEILEEDPRPSDAGPAEDDWLPRRPRGPIDVGFHQLVRGRPAKALQIWQAVPHDHPDYARAQRFIGYKLYDRTWGQPGRGVAYVHRSLLADPMSGNAWQDVGRIYWHALRDTLR